MRTSTVLAIGAAVLTAIGVGAYLVTRTGRPQPKYDIGQSVYLGNAEYETVRQREWREATRWIDGETYPAQWWYYFGPGEAPLWWPEDTIIRVGYVEEVPMA